MSSQHKGPLGIDTLEEDHQEEDRLGDHPEETHQEEVHQGGTHQEEVRQREETQITTTVKGTKSTQEKSVAISMCSIETEPKRRNSKWNLVSHE